jgi:hypothetical protein
VRKIKISCSVSYFSCFASPINLSSNSLDLSSFLALLPINCFPVLPPLLSLLMYPNHFNHGLPAMSHSWPSSSLVKRLKVSSERQDLCWIERNAVVWPWHEMELLHFMLFTTLDKNNVSYFEIFIWQT